MEITAIFRAHVPLSFSPFNEGMQVEGVSHQNQVDLYFLAMIHYLWIISNALQQIQQQTRKEEASTVEKTRRAREQRHVERLTDWKRAEQKLEELHYHDWETPFLTSVARQAAHFDSLSADPLHPGLFC